MKIKKNDTVIVIAGNDSGKRGKVLKLFPEKKRAIVEGVHFIKRHTRPRKQGEKSGILEKEAPVDVSNLMVVCAKCNKGVRVGARVLTDGKRARVCKSCGEMLDKI
jgi:large subunit ribosomal protein L24